MRQRLNDLVLRMARMMGYEIIPSWRMADHDRTETIRGLLQRMHIECVLDVGANRGQFRDLLRGPMGYTGRIVSFEPQPELAEFLQARAADDPGWDIRACALGADEGEAELHVMRGSSFNSFLEPVPEAQSMARSGNEVIAARKVTVRTLEDVLEDIGPLNLARTMLKIDTQGFDMAVVEGAGTRLRDIPVLLMEVSMLPIYRNMPDGIQALSTLRERGFDVAGMFVVNRDDFLRVIEFDCLLLNREHLGLTDGAW